ncbi:hypothetical protein BT69DRAFT_1258380 [Atractiella rhizophila]|nr:hypothetical protein BT69DRAFT_1258380 [Atractiella rhizophila]
MEIKKFEEGASPEDRVAFADFLTTIPPDSFKATREELLSTAFSLCWDFRVRAPVEKLLSHFDHRAVCIEHGHPNIAPFLGRQFRTTPGVEGYFKLLSRFVKYRDIDFPVDDFTVDLDKAVVHCTGEGYFTWIPTGIEWKETFTYRLVIVKRKIMWYEVWADAGSMLLAKMGIEAANSKTIQS